MTLSPRTLLRAGLGIGISLVALFLVLRSVDLATVGEIIGGAAPAWVAVMGATVLLDLSFRALRWHRLLLPVVPGMVYRRTLGFTALGYLSNNVLPARLGELVRVHALGEREGVPRTTVLGTVVVERITDTAMVVGIASLAVITLSARGMITNAILLGLAFATLLVVGLAVGLAAHRLPGAERVTAFLARWPRIVELGRRLREGLAVAGRPRTLGPAILFGLAAWAASIGTFFAAGEAIGLELAVGEAALICTGVALATIVPSGPGYLGTFELTAVGIAGTFGIPADEAFAMALLAHAAIVIVTSVGGVISIAALGLWRPARPATNP